jgi:transposase
MLYVDLDVHRRRTRVSVMDVDGHELFNRSVPNDRERLADVLCGADPGTPVVLESAYSLGWLAELVDDMGLEPHLAHAKSCKAIAHARLKNDRVDARTLAHLLRANLLPEAWIAPRPVKELRMILRHRAALVRQRTVFKTRVRAVLADRGIDAPEALWAGPGRTWLAKLELPTALIVNLIRGEHSAKRTHKRTKKKGNTMTTIRASKVTAMSAFGEHDHVDSVDLVSGGDESPIDQIQIQAFGGGELEEPEGFLGQLLHRTGE